MALELSAGSDFLDSRHGKASPVVLEEFGAKFCRNIAKQRSGYFRPDCLQAHT
jgi:hypothetical protein